MNKPVSSFSEGCFRVTMLHNDYNRYCDNRYDHVLLVGYPKFRDANINVAYRSQCTGQNPTEIQAGELLINKKRAWKGLWMTSFVNLHSHLFLKRLFRGMKMTLSAAFNTTNTPYSMAPLSFHGVGWAFDVPGRQQKYFCANTFAQRNPETGKVIWLHRFESSPLMTNMRRRCCDTPFDVLFFQ